MDKEAFAIMSGCRGEFILKEEVTLLSDHCSLAYKVCPTVLVAELLKTAAQRLLHRRAVCGSSGMISRAHRRRTTAGGSLRSWWRRAGMDAECEISGSEGCRRVAFYAGADATYVFLLKSAIKSSQLQAR